MNVENRINRIEEKLRLGKESDVVPLVIVVTQYDINNKEKGIAVIGGEAKKWGNNGQEIIETA